MFLKSKSGRRFLLVVAIAVVVKLWLTSEIRILPIFGPHDSLNFVLHAQHVVAGEWFGRYDDLTLIKGPSFPLFMALIDELGIPLPLAHQLLCAFASLVACLAVQPVIRSWKWLSFVFVVLFFNPFTFSTSAWVALRSQINDSVALLALACAIALFVRRTWPPRATLPWLIGLGVSSAVFSFTREESIWLLPGLVGVVAAYLWSVRKRPRREFVRRLASCAIPVAIWIGYWGILVTLNGTHYGWYTVVEMTSSEYVSAYNSLARISLPPGATDPNAERKPGSYGDISVPRAVREVAYAASPAARELQPSLEGKPGKEWTRISCSVGYSCTDIPAGWFVWALRDAVMYAGHYRTGADARAYYLRLAAELDQACDSGRIRCRAKGRTLSPPVTAAHIPGILANIVYGVRLSTTFALLTVNPYGEPQRQPAIVDIYELVTRDVRPQAAGTTFYGWLIDPALRSITVEGPGGVDGAAGITFSTSPDVLEAFSTKGAPPPAQAGLARFVIVSTCTEQCMLVVADNAPAATRIPLGLTTTDFKNEHVHYHLDNAAPIKAGGGDFSLKQAALGEIGRTYQSVVPFWIVLALGLGVLRLVRVRRKRGPFGSEHLVLTLGTVLSVGALIAILALIQTVSFPALTEDYMIGIPALLLYAIAVVVAIEGPVVLRLVLRYIPAPTRPSARESVGRS